MRQLDSGMARQEFRNKYYCNLPYSQDLLTPSTIDLNNRMYGTEDYKKFMGLPDSLKRLNEVRYFNYDILSKDGMIEEINACEILEDVPNTYGLKYQETWTKTAGRFKIVYKYFDGICGGSYQTHLYTKDGWIKWTELFSIYTRNEYKSVLHLIKVEEYVLFAAKQISESEYDQYIYSNAMKWAGILYNQAYNRNYEQFMWILNRFYGLERIFVKPAYVSALKTTIQQARLRIKDHPRTAVSDYKITDMLERVYIFLSTGEKVPHHLFKV